MRDTLAAEIVREQPEQPTKPAKPKSVAKKPAAAKSVAGAAVIPLTGMNGNVGRMLRAHTA